MHSADVAAADVAGSIGMEAWDHFNAWGSMEGRIWHSELCNEDGTNKRSTCERKHTSDQCKIVILFRFACCPSR